MAGCTPEFKHLLLAPAALAARLATGAKLAQGPLWLSGAGALRLKQGLRALEAYLRRVLVYMALALEPSLCPDPRIRPYHAAPTGRPWARQGGGLRIFPGEGAGDFPDALYGRAADKARASGRVPAGPVLERLAGLQRLIAAPEKTARRLAFYLARKRAGLIAPPGFARAGLPRRYGTALSAQYDSLGPAILIASRARPPPLGPVLRPGPRIRCV